MTIKAIRGFKDILPGESVWWRAVEETAVRVLHSFGYEEIRLPVVERTELFARSIGEDTDIVAKEMYTFTDRHGESVTLRPEATAGMVRALIEGNLALGGRPVKLYALGPMFRYERPQKGRQRQFHQLDVEAFNVAAPAMDAEMIVLLDHFLAEVGVKEVEFHLNSLGCPACRPGFQPELTRFLRKRRAGLCPDCRRRLETNPLRVLDCKVPSCGEAVAEAPRILDFLCSGCRDHFDQVQKAVKRAGVSFALNPRLVRGLDYYTRTTFEALAGGLGAQDAVAGGGRYDGLVKALGGPDVPGIGFAVGLERLIMLLSTQGRAETPRPAYFVAALNEAAVQAGFGLVQGLRRKGCWAEMDYAPGSLKSQMRRADKLGAAETLILGPEELEKGRILVKDMQTGVQREEDFDPENVAATVKVLAAVETDEEK